MVYVRPLKIAKFRVKIEHTGVLSVMFLSQEGP